MTDENRKKSASFNFAQALASLVSLFGGRAGTDPGEKESGKDQKSPPKKKTTTIIPSSDDPGVRVHEGHGPPLFVKSMGEAQAWSLWVINYFTACGFMELLPWVGSGYDMERFGIKAVATPRHADVLIVSGYVTVKAAKRIKRIYDQMPAPKHVMALGSCPMTGGMYWDSYSTIKNIDEIIPVDIWVVGCPPKPENIGHAIVMAMKAIKGS
jgi:NADH-quinone oxidoreductase B subunit